MSRKPSRFKRFREENEAPLSAPLSASASESILSNALDEQQSKDYMDLHIALPSSSNNSSSSSSSSSAPKQSKKSLVSMMEESREQGLAAPISTSNKGFMLLMKKGGFSEGQGLGKDEQGITVPLKVEAKVRDKCDMTGIGVAAAKHRQQDRIESHKADWDQRRHQMQLHFAASMSKHHSENKLKKDLKNVIKVIYKLDLERGWFSHELSEIFDELNKLRESGYNASERTLEELVYEGINDEQSTQDDAKLILKRKIRQASSIMDFVEEPFTDTLTQLLDLLRCEHDYCYYCGVKFHDQTDMAQNCPGFFEVDH